MHPVLFEFNTPGFLRFILPDTIYIYSYGAMIALGALLGFAYTAWQGKKQLNISFDKTNELVLYIVIAAIIGGKLFVFFEDPSRYIQNPFRLIKNFNQGFVFYGSLLVAVPVMIYFFRKNKIPVLPMLDIMAITTCIVHGTGRIGCFFAGCCYGIPSEGPFAIVFTHPACQAEPLNTPLHPTQLYDVILIYSIMIILLVLSRHKKFDGQLFLIYLMLYPVGRIIVEIYRGDLSRGYVIRDWVTNSQLISILIIITAIVFYARMNNKIQPGKQRKDKKPGSTLSSNGG